MNNNTYRFNEPRDGTLGGCGIACVAARTTSLKLLFMSSSCVLGMGRVSKGSMNIPFWFESVGREGHGLYRDGSNVGSIEENNTSISTGVCALGSGSGGAGGN